MRDETSRVEFSRVFSPANLSSAKETHILFGSHPARVLFSLQLTFELLSLANMGFLVCGHTPSTIFQFSGNQSLAVFLRTISRHFPSLFLVPKTGEGKFRNIGEGSTTFAKDWRNCWKRARILIWWICCFEKWYDGKIMELKYRF